MQPYPIMIPWEKRNPKKILRYLQHMTAVKGWKEKFVLSLILRKAIGA